MAIYDVFNGDADGICALAQLRLAFPEESTLITGVKRDIDLLKNLSPNTGDTITVLDISMDKNKDALRNCLDAVSDVLYIDHHFPGDILEHTNLQSIIDQSPNICTSILMDQYLSGKFRSWAVVGAFGDNLRESPRRLAESLGLEEKTMNKFEQLGIYINYNGYGSELSDLFFHPGELYRIISQHTDPLDFVNEDTESFQLLENGYQ